MSCPNPRGINLKDKINILRNLNLSEDDIKEINLLIDDIYAVKNNKIHFTTKKELDKIFPQDLKNKLIEPISNTPYKRGYLYVILILANYANKLIKKGYDMKSSIINVLYCGTKLLSIFWLNDLPMNLFIKNISDDDFLFCDYLLISKILNKDFEKKETIDIKKLRMDFKEGMMN